MNASDEFAAIVIVAALDLCCTVCVALYVVNQLLDIWSEAMKWTEAYHRNYWNAQDVPPGGIHMTIATITLEDVNGDAKPQSMKPVLYLHGEERGIVVNKTNGEILRQSFGDNVEDCIGGEVKISQGRVMFQGRLVPSITLIPVSKSPQPQEPQPVRHGYTERLPHGASDPVRFDQQR